ncbi:MFS general substrate transporter [Aspergillus sclerotioniger CBS 115572]|uniref:MFS general substrate transporter n=1 Tax=Aspergillus sclerotioniger CBS 115572 TaxID=1450535 RepID=A0A317XDD8_9EURO|nr:MFS general substrate transporter [Aspergillus sclerotioniger CBS 115572]PWY96345.1 MFS general substrate transporter [Aspergillus sclerotioniger CBS 115572]
MGMSQWELGLAWLAGPLAGTFVQPLVGILKDRYGHCQRLVTGGIICLIIALLALGWAPDLVHLGKRGPVLGKAVAITAIVALNIAIQPVQLGLRTLIIETCSPDQQTLASAWAARMTGAGNIIAQFAGSVDTRKLSLVLTGSQFKNLCLITAFSLMLTIFVLAFILRDESPISKVTVCSRPLHVSMDALRSAWKTLPQGVIGVWKVQFFSWMGWFPFLFYAATYIESHLGEISEQTREATRDIRVESLHFGPQAMLINACVSFFASLLMPAVWDYHQRSRKIDARSTLMSVWMVSQVLFGGCMIGLFLASTTATATALMGILGICWACTGWIPYALISTTISQRIAGTHSSEIATTGAPRPGLVMSLHNVSIAGPQIPAALVASLILYAVPESSSPLAYVLLVGGFSGLIGAWMILGIDSMEF